MYTTVVDNGSRIKVKAGKHQADFSLDGSLMNPLEGFYATLAACAAVYAKKACQTMGISAQGIEIDCKPFAGVGGPLKLAKFRTEVRFPAAFSADQKTAVLESIAKCAVKEVVTEGGNIEFTVTEVQSRP